MSFHQSLAGADVHTLVAFEFADAGTRTSHSSFVAADVGKMVRQTDDGSLWMITSTAPAYTGVGQADNGLAQRALETAWIGTNAADQANDIAVSALNTAWSGTNAGDQAYDVAVSGLTAAWAGTNAGDQAYDIAVSGLSTAWIGTNAGDQAYQLAGESLTLAQVGTNAGDQAYDVAVNALDTAWAGTSAGNQAYDVAVSGLSTAWAGTNAGDQAYDVAVNALSTAWAGTSALGDYVQKSGDVMTGTLSTPNITVGVGTLPANFSGASTDWYMGTYTIDITDVAAQTVYVTGSLTIAVTGLEVTGASASVRFIHPSDRDVEIGIEADWDIMPSSPTSLTSAKKSMLSIQSFGPLQSDVVGAYAAIT
jgi:hypothetical protein